MIALKQLHFSALLATAIILLPFAAFTQKRRSPQPKPTVAKQSPTFASAKPNYATVIDERLAILRFEPSLHSLSLGRMQSGRTLQVIGERQADGVTFYEVQVPPDRRGWVQTDAVVVGNKRGDDERLARLVYASKGFEQIERATIFLETFPKSALRPAVLLLIGDLAEEMGQKLARDAFSRFNLDEMKASGAPTHSFYMNYNGLDRYRKLGINFLFNSNKRLFHYDGANWREIVERHPTSQESAEAHKRLESLQTKLEQ